MRLRDWLIAGGLMLALVFVGKEALGHQTMGRLSHQWAGFYLFGQKIGDPSGEPVNCCLHKSDTGQTGDCDMYPEEDVRIVDGGYLLGDGEFILESDTNVSPLSADGEYHYWRCKYKASEKSHCWFAPPRGM